MPKTESLLLNSYQSDIERRKTRHYRNDTAFSISEIMLDFKENLVRKCNKLTGKAAVNLSRLQAKPGSRHRPQAGCVTNRAYSSDA